MLARERCVGKSGLTNSVSVKAVSCASSHGVTLFLEMLLLLELALLSFLLFLLGLLFGVDLFLFSLLLSLDLLLLFFLFLLLFLLGIFLGIVLFLLAEKVSKQATALVSGLGAALLVLLLLIRDGPMSADRGTGDCTSCGSTGNSLTGLSMSRLVGDCLRSIFGGSASGSASVGIGNGVRGSAVGGGSCLALTRLAGLLWSRKGASGTGGCRCT